MNAVNRRAQFPPRRVALAAVAGGIAAAAANTGLFLVLHGLGVDFEWLMAHADDVDGNVMLDLGGHHITLRGVSTSMLHHDDFLV